jgi:hypothetical protein
MASPPQDPGLAGRDPSIRRGHDGRVIFERQGRPLCVVRSMAADLPAFAASYYPTEFPVTWYRPRSSSSSRRSCRRRRRRRYVRLLLYGAVVGGANQAPARPKPDPEPRPGGGGGGGDSGGGCSYSRARPCQPVAWRRRPPSSATTPSLSPRPTNEGPEPPGQKRAYQILLVILRHKHPKSRRRSTLDPLLLWLLEATPIPSEEEEMRRRRRRCRRRCDG